MRNTSVKNHAGDNAGSTPPRRKEMHITGSNSFNRQTKFHLRESLRQKAIGKCDGTGRTIFYRDENDGRDYIL